MATKTAAKPTAAREQSAATKQQVSLVFGSDDFLVQSRAKQLVDSLVDKSAGDFGLEVVEGRVDNAGQAVAAIKRVDEALNTLAFFGGGKTVWLKNANFLGASKTALAGIVVEQLESFGESLKRGLAPAFHLVISAVELDKRRSFFKTVQKAGEIVECGGTDKRGNVDMEQLESFARDKARSFGQTIADGALQSLLALTGGNYRSVASEVQKLATYIGDRKEITDADVSAVGSPSAESLPWDLQDAIGERNLSKALGVLDRLMFQGESEVGLLFALVNRVRTLLLLRELMDRKLLPASAESGWYYGNLQRVAQEVGDELPADKKFNPLLQNPFVVYKTVQQARLFTPVELQRAMELLLDANKQLVSSSIDPKIVLQQIIIALIQRRER